MTKSKTLAALFVLVDDQTDRNEENMKLRRRYNHCLSANNELPAK